MARSCVNDSRALLGKLRAHHRQRESACVEFGCQVSTRSINSPCWPMALVFSTSRSVTKLFMWPAWQRNPFVCGVRPHGDCRKAGIEFQQNDAGQPPRGQLLGQGKLFCRVAGLHVQGLVIALVKCQSGEVGGAAAFGESRLSAVLGTSRCPVALLTRTRAAAKAR
jgi:hypothetical protein